MLSINNVELQNIERGDVNLWDIKNEHLVLIMYFSANVVKIIYEVFDIDSSFYHLLVNANLTNLEVYICDVGSWIAIVICCFN